MSESIRLERVRKVFRVPRRGRGLRGALTTLMSRAVNEVVALEGLSFSIDAGQIVGYIGPNGAGKSTTVKLISGILHADSGEIRVLGRDPFRQRAEHVRGIGVIFGQRTQLYWDVPVRESYRLLGTIYGVSSADLTRRIERFDELLGIGRLLDLPPRRLSLGQRMACDIAASLLHQPGVLFLDEPTIGLDVTLKERIREFICEMNRELGTTVILTTHDLTDIERLAHRVLILDQGRLVHDGPLDVIRQQMSNIHHLDVEFASPADGAALQELGAELAGRLEDFAPAPDGLRLSISFNPARIPSPELYQCLHGRFMIRDFSLRPCEIEELVRRFYQDQKPDTP